MSRLRVSGTTVVPVNDASDSDSPSAQQTQQAHHRHHHAHHAQKMNRSRTKRRRGADSQDGIDEAGASEELLMMLTEYLQKNSESVMRVSDRHQQEHSGSGGGGDGSEQDEEGQAATRGVGGAGGKPFLRGLGNTDETEAARKSAEQALLDARKAQAAALPTASSTYEPLKVMLEFLALPGGDVVSPARLAQVRERLVQAVEKPAGAAPPQQQSANLLLPLLLLNLTRRRTDDERARGSAILKSLLSRRRMAV
jgi:type III secretion regulatory protein HpaA